MNVRDFPQPIHGKHHPQKKKPKRTGECFTTAAKLQQEEYFLWTLVHGIPLGRSGDAEGLRYPHAWLESPDGNTVLDPNLYEKGINPMVPLDIYYQLGNITETFRYTSAGASAEMLNQETYGPWEDRLIELDKEIG